MIETGEFDFENRMVAPNTINTDSDEIDYSLRPKTLSEYIGQESNSFLERYYDGDITAMLSAYIENDRLSETEIDTLRSLLSKRSKKGGN